MAFKVAVLSNSDEADEHAFPIDIRDERVYSEVISCSLALIPNTFHHLLGVQLNDESTSGDPTKKRLPSNLPKWRHHQGMVKSFCRLVTELLKQISEKSMIEFVLKELERSQAMIYFACFAKVKIGKEFLKVGLWEHEMNRLLSTSHRSCSAFGPCLPRVATTITITTPTTMPTPKEQAARSARARPRPSLWSRLVSYRS